MKLVWHIFRKDLRRLAVPLALWALLLVAKYALGWRLITFEGNDAVRFKNLANLGQLLVALEIAANFLIATRLVHEDPLVSEQAFWLTRPVARARLFAAKLFGAALMFGVLPLLLAVPWWLANHYDASLMGEAALELVAIQAGITGLAFLMAALTDGLARLLLWMLVAGAVAVWWFTLAAAGMELGAQAQNAGTALGDQVQNDVSLTRSCVMAGIFVLGVAGVVTHQFLTRRLARSLVLTGLCVGALGMVSGTWSWNWVPTWRPEFSGGPPMSIGAQSGVTFAVARARVPEFTAKTPAYVKADLRMTLAARNVPPDSVLLNGPTTHTWRWSDGTTLVREESSKHDEEHEEERSKALARLLNLPPPSNDAWLRVIGLLAWRDAELSGRWARITPSFAMRMRRDPPAYTAKLNFLLARPEVMFETPMQPSGRLWHGATSVRVLGTQRMDNGYPMVNAIESQPVFVRVALSLAMVHMIQYEKSQWQHLLVNHRQGKMLEMYGLNDGGLVIGSVRIARLGITDIWGAWPAAEWKTRWDGATLAGVGFRDYRYFYQELKVDRFEVEK